MIKLARLHAIDWTLSTTPTRRGVRVFLVAYLGPVVLVGICALALLILIRIESGPPTPKRSFSSMDFLPPTSAYPADYEVIEAPGWAGEDSSWGIGDEDDAYAVYKPARATVRDVQIVVYYQSHWDDALDKYHDQLQYMTYYEPVSLITFQSGRAQEWTLQCTNRGAPYNWLLCAYLARYDEFVVNARTVVRQDNMSIAEFESVLQAIDDRAIELLGPTPMPMP